MGYEMNDLLNLVIEENASDLHIHVDCPPTLRVDGSMVQVEGPDLTPKDAEDLMVSIASSADQELTKTLGGADFGFTFMDKARFRVSLLKSKGHFGIVLRKIPNYILPLEDIGYPEGIKELLKRPRGLILVTGPTGSGKSTTLAAMVDWMNQFRDGHIITIEDPIEYLHQHKNCIITQRELGIDVPSYTEAIRGAMRQDPDIILVGEMRDLDTIKAAISAAETGHLVLGTVHTTGADRTVDRLVNAFPPGSRDEIRTELASTVIACISQVLMKKIESGLIAAFEIMIKTDAIANLIRENKAFRITSEIQTGAARGMITLDAHLQTLLVRKLIYPQDAIDKSRYPDDMRQFIEDNKLDKALHK